VSSKSKKVATKRTAVAAKSSKKPGAKQPKKRSSRSGGR